MLVAFDLTSAAYELIVAQLEATNDRPHDRRASAVPSFSPEAERALRGARPVDGGWRVRCGVDCARAIAGWFDSMGVAVAAPPRHYSDPGLLVRITEEAAMAIRASLAAVSGVRLHETG